MRDLLIPVSVGLTAGAVSWASAGLLTERFEPFDTGTGFYSSQVILSVFAAYIGYRWGILSLLLYLACAHFGMNVYAFIAGSSEQRAWFLVGMITTLLLLIYPLAFGMAGKLVQLAKKAMASRIERTQTNG